MLHARVRHDDVEPAEPLDRRVNRGRVGLGVGQIRLERDAGSVGQRIQVDSEDVHPFLLQPLGYRATDPTGRTGHERRLA